MAEWPGFFAAKVGLLPRPGLQERARAEGVLGLKVWSVLL